MSWRATSCTMLIALCAGLSACSEPPTAGGDAADAEAETVDQPTLLEYTPADEPPTGEVLIAEPPEGWLETGAMQTPAMRMAEYGPREREDGNLERITFESQTGQPLPDPIQFVLAVSRDLAVRCKEFQDINISSGLENGYPTSVRLMICPEFKDAPNGQVVMAKAIQGNEQFYVITRRLRTPPLPESGQPLTAQEMAEWTTHLRGIELCDTREASHPCPDFSLAEDPA